jgi:sRNA-binding carbon storage regulator CsrA
MGLALTRKVGESLLLLCKEIGPIKITITGHGKTPSHIKVHIEAPQNVDIFREELLTSRSERGTDSHGSHK